MADGLVSPATELLGMSAVVLAILPGAYLVLRDKTSMFGIPLAAGPMDISELSLMYALLAGVLDPIRKLSSVFSKLKRAGAAADRVFVALHGELAGAEEVSPVHASIGIVTIDESDLGVEPARLFRMAEEALASVRGGGESRCGSRAYGADKARAVGAR